MVRYGVFASKPRGKTPHIQSNLFERDLFKRGLV
jgi:hypothetical protein